MLNYSETETKKLIKKHSLSKKQTQTDILEATKKRFKETNDLLLQLEEKKEKIEDEIKHLQQKQIDRKKFISEISQNH